MINISKLSQAFFFDKIEEIHYSTLKKIDVKKSYKTANCP